MNNDSVGVGPHPKPWPVDSIYDRELLENGDRRNVLDRYRYWTNEAIKQDLDGNRFTLQIAIENWQHDFNIGTIVRNANAFNVTAVHIIGKRRFNRRGAMVTDRYIHIIHHNSVDDFATYMKTEGTRIVAIDILPGSTPLSQSSLPEKVVLVFGGEGPGLSPEMQNQAEQIINIEQFGSTRSVNVGVASGIAMYAWLQQHILPKK